MVLSLLIVLGLWTVTRSWFIIAQVTSEMERKLGGKVAIGKAAYHGDGRIVFSDVSLRARTLKGTGGEVARIGRAVVTIDLSSILSGIHIQNVEIDDVVLRLSEDAHNSGHVNFMALQPDWSGRGGGGHSIPPRVSIRNAALEFGTHTGAKYETSGRRLVSGEMYPTAGASGWYNFQLVEVDERGQALGPSGIFIKGQWNGASNEYHARIDGLELDERIYKMCPQQARLLWDRMKLQGTVDGVMLDWKPGQPFSVEFAVKNVALTLPIEAKELWARYKEGTITPIPNRPRMRVSSGTIRLGSDSLVLDNLKGELGSTDADLIGVPYNISFTMSSLPSIDWSNREQWMDEVLKTAPFELKFKMDEFSLGRNEAGEAPAVDLPLVVARVLAKFQVTDWVLSSSLEMSRGVTGTDADGRLIEAATVTSGQAYIHKASGRYQKFPYQLDDIDAYLQFDNEKIVVHYLTGKGSGNARLRIAGEIAPPDNNARVSLRVTGTDIPLDDRFRAALKGRELQAFDAMFHRQSADSLAKAGLLLDQAQIDTLKAQEQAGIDRLTQLKGAADAGQPEQAAEIRRIEADVARQRRSIEAGPFQLAGTVDLDLNIDRPAGAAQPTTTTGTIGIRNVGLLYEKFPYPLRFAGGTLNWMADRIAIAPGADGRGLHFTAPGGGEGSVSGELLFSADQPHRLMPDLVVTVNGDAMTPSLYAAIPLSKSERSENEAIASIWPGGALSHAATIVQGIGLSGECDYSGTIKADAAGAIAYDFGVTMQGGSAVPTLQLAQAVGASMEFWPTGLILRDVSGAVTVNRDRVQWTNVAGHDGPSEIVANGTVDLSSGAPGTQLSIDFRNLPLESNVANLSPPQVLEQRRAAWDRYQPDGVYDAALAYNSRLDSNRQMTIGVWPRQVSLLLDEKRVIVTGRSGKVVLGDGDLKFDQFCIGLAGDRDRDDGLLTLNGSMSLQAGGGQDIARLDGTWASGRMESSLVPELIAAFGTQNQVDQYHQCNPSGNFDATLHLTSGPGDAPRAFEAAIQPHSLGGTWNGTAVFAEIEGGEVLLKPGVIQLHELRGKHSHGVFDLSGTIHTADTMDADLSIGYSGRLRSTEVEAILPEQARATLEAIQFNDGDAGTRADFNIHMARVQRESPEPVWQTQVNGRVQTHAASFEAGVEFSQVDGEFDLDIQHVPDSPVWLTLQARAKRAVVLGQELANIEAPMALAPDGEVLHIPSMRAEVRSGIVTAEATVGVGDRRDYQTSLQLVGVPADAFLNARPDQSNDTVDPVPQHSYSPGEVYGNLTLAGSRGDSYTRSGRAVLRVLHGKITSIPLALQVMQLVQLTFPFSGTFDYADAQMYVTGDRVVFERIMFESTVGTKAMLQLIGEGEMDINTLNLNTRFRSRSGVAVIRDTVGGILDRLYQIEVTGPLRDPRARVVPLPTK